LKSIHVQNNACIISSQKKKVMKALKEKCIFFCIINVVAAPGSARSGLSSSKNYL